MIKEIDIDSFLRNGWVLGYKIVRKKNKKLVSFMAGCTSVHPHFEKLKAYRYGLRTITKRNFLKNHGPLGVMTSFPAAVSHRDDNWTPDPSGIYQCLFLPTITQKIPRYFQGKCSMKFTRTWCGHALADMVILLKEIKEA